MLLTLNRPIVFFDLETTGTNPAYDRIVEFGGIKLHPDGSRETLVKKVHPGRAIPPGAEKIHGISDEDVKDCPHFESIAEELLSFFRDSDIGGFSVSRFDIPLLMAEFQRAGVEFSLESVNVVDAQKIFHKREPRNLTAALKFYCDEELVDAHGAEADTEATIKVVEGQLAKYSDLPRDVEGLDKESHPDRENCLDPEGKIKWSGDEAVIGFGKKSGRTLRDLCEEDRQYLKWILNNNFSLAVKRIVKDALNGKFPEKQ